MADWAISTRMWDKGCLRSEIDSESAREGRREKKSAEDAFSRSSQRESSSVHCRVTYATTSGLVSVETSSDTIGSPGRASHNASVFARKKSSSEMYWTAME